MCHIIDNSKDIVRAVTKPGTYHVLTEQKINVPKYEALPHVLS